MDFALPEIGEGVYEAELIFGPYAPSRVRETPAEYGHSGSYWSRDQ